MKQRLLIETRQLVTPLIQPSLVMAHAIHNMILDGYNVTSTDDLRLSAHESSSNAFSQIGETLLEYISKVNTSGVMDRLVFDANRSPASSKFDIVNLCSYGFEKVGTWNSVNGLIMEEN